MEEDSVCCLTCIATLCHILRIYTTDLRIPGLDSNGRRMIRKKLYGTSKPLGSFSSSYPLHQLRIRHDATCSAKEIITKSNLAVYRTCRDMYVHNHI